MALCILKCQHAHFDFRITLEKLHFIKLPVLEAWNVLVYWSHIGLTLRKSLDYAIFKNIYFVLFVLHNDY